MVHKNETDTALINNVNKLLLIEVDLIEVRPHREVLCLRFTLMPGNIPPDTAGLNQQEQGTFQHFTAIFH